MKLSEFSQLRPGERVRLQDLRGTVVVGYRMEHVTVSMDQPLGDGNRRMVFGPSICYLLTALVPKPRRSEDVGIH